MKEPEINCAVIKVVNDLPPVVNVSSNESFICPTDEETEAQSQNFLSNL